LSLKSADAAVLANVTSQHELLAAAAIERLDDSVELDLNIGNGMQVRALAIKDAAMLVDATSRESAPALWGPRPAEPYSLHDAQAALLAWDPAAGGQFSIGILRGQALLGAVGLMPDHSGSIELAYWIRPEQRGRGIASRAVSATTLWAHRSLAVPRIWLEIHPGNGPSLRVAQRAGYHFEQRLSQRCRNWVHEDAEHDSWHDCLIWAHVSD
jgi:RimJ/RimL family protein N-acetyltransferase